MPESQPHVSGPQFTAPESAALQPATPPTSAPSAGYSPVPTGPAPVPAYAPTGELVLNLKKPAGAMGMIVPVVTIDGFPVNVGWGRNAIPAPAGVRQVSAASSYLWTYGAARLPVTVEPGRTSEVFYSGPFITFMSGAMGLTPQKRPGMTVLVVLLAVVALVTLLAIVGAVLGS